MADAVSYVYLLRCRDGSLYCGWTTDLDDRVAAHQQGKGGRYTRSRLPVELAAAWRTPDRTTARSLEGRIKREPKQHKERLVAGAPLEDAVRLA